MPGVPNPTAIVSYSHSEMGWTEEQTRKRRDLVQRFVYALRTLGGIDADADIFHMNEDWSRWGPAQVAACDFVLVIISTAWRNAWIGQGDPLTNKGVRAEADAVRSIEQRGRPELQQRVRLIDLGDGDGDDVPVGMHGIARYRITGFSQQEMVPLLRDLTGQPEFVKPPLGSVPVFPPAMTEHTAEPATTDQGSIEKMPDPGAPSTGRGERTLRINELKAQLAALPESQPGEGPHLPWFRTRQQIETRLWAELSELERDRRGSGTGAADVPTVDWTPVAGVEVGWTEPREPTLNHNSPAVAVHVVPLSAPPLSQRIRASLDAAVSRVVRTSGVLEDACGITTTQVAGDLVLQTDPVRVGMGSVVMGGFAGLRIGASGQISIWYSLPRDTLGAVLDEHQVKHNVKDALGLAAAVLERTHPNGPTQVAIAAELVHTTTLTTGTVEDLGRRSSASMPGAFRRPTRMSPDESINVRHLEPDGSWSVADTVAQILVGEWRNPSR